ncbi:MAG: transcriptional repressor [Pseudomonadota bacterium]
MVFKTTKLRNEILKILRRARKPLKAYEILEQLRKIRPNAEPPTVYRVLKYLIEKDVIHEIAHEHSYTLCQLGLNNADSHSTSFLFICNACHDVFETSDTQLAKPLERICEQNNFFVNCSTIELLGHCEKCH